MVAVLVALGVASCSRGDAGGTMEWVTGMRPGDCADTVGAPALEVTRVRQIPCDRPHALETYARVPYPLDRAADAADDSTSSAEYPGNVVLQVFAREACATRFRTYLGSGTRRPWYFLTYLYPSAASWTAADVRPVRLGLLTHLVGKVPRADRSVVCVVRTTGQPLTGSVHGRPYPAPTPTPSPSPAATVGGGRR